MILQFLHYNNEYIYISYSHSFGKCSELISKIIQSHYGLRLSSFILNTGERKERGEVRRSAAERRLENCREVVVFFHACHTNKFLPRGVWMRLRVSEMLWHLASALLHTVYTVTAPALKRLSQIEELLTMRNQIFPFPPLHRTWFFHREPPGSGLSPFTEAKQISVE